ncbi:Methylenetetrahydrofolate--tRNA-(uracil-5-)-meth yltransferase trmFO [Flexistipes sinusarabici DSM 4947]|uniref:Methylenetetrahydrofolate--tRNA-(uracil-5-)-methyltransferase TrmFO n=2 Tax=Flexistipes sinusarabici TaxID=2352 RepID=F8E530_FLESM|nr:methylenetetrahydrofolate--tRNA-(uracil(54)-C(5))-methyltransferase (FADH(2)-oxidizing) TrmFO [Flexistipes sinusarabici]AEI15666.1 Methylenetetrahydrofolate--tRNA-(uracil-5-)-meth yltransferase trmFO [Flexistipes sinusarabici DSM 4947]
MRNNVKTITIIGGGLAGTEAAYQLAEHGFNVKLYEMRPDKMTPAHSTGFLGELVCSNSLKSESLSTGSGLLKAELDKLGSIIIKTAQETRVPAGNSLAVDRQALARQLTEIIKQHENIEIINEEIKDIPADRPLIIATGPLTSDSFAQTLMKELVSEELFFYDAIAPVISADSIDYNHCFFKSRYDKGEADYLNCPLDKKTFELFYNELLDAEKVPLKDFEEASVFEACMPLEEMAERGEKTLTFGPLKPVGLDHPDTGDKYYAVLQLRKENKKGTAYNLVGCQTKMKIPEQKRVFRIIPALRNAEFLRYGSIHRNTYINSPLYLANNYRMKEQDIYFAGQITGVEGYIESIASGLTAAYDLIFRLLLDKQLNFPETTALSALQRYVQEYKNKYTPSNFHFGLLPRLEEKIKKKKLKKEKLSERSLKDLQRYWVDNYENRQSSR